MGLPRYIINFDEFVDRLGNDISEYIREHIKDNIKYDNLNNINELLNILKDKLPYKKYIKITKRIKKLNVKYESEQLITGKILDIPAIKNNYKLQFKFKDCVSLTGLSLNCTGWKKEDTFDLTINKAKIIENCSLKEIGEHIYFNTYFRVNAQTPICFNFNNKSGNSRQIIVDLEYINMHLKTTSIIADKHEDIIIPANSRLLIGFVDIPTDTNKWDITGYFKNITGLKWPDLNIVDPNGTWFGFNTDYLDNKNACKLENLDSCTKIEYTGWAVDTEKFTVHNPIAGRWYFQGRGDGSLEDSKVKISSNLQWNLIKE